MSATALPIKLDGSASTPSRHRWLDARAGDRPPDRWPAPSAAPVKGMHTFSDCRGHISVCSEMMERENIPLVARPGRIVRLSTRDPERGAPCRMIVQPSQQQAFPVHRRSQASGSAILKSIRCFKRETIFPLAGLPRGSGRRTRGLDLTHDTSGAFAPKADSLDPAATRCEGPHCVRLSDCRLTSIELRDRCILR